MSGLDLEAMVKQEEARLKKEGLLPDQEEKPEVTLSDSAQAALDEVDDEVEIGVKIQPPDKDAPGFLRRIRHIANFQSAMKDTEKFTPDVVDSIVSFLLDYVVEPKDRDEAREVILDFSEEQFQVAMDRLSGVTDQVPPQQSSS